MTQESEPGRAIALASLPNLRDVGGYRTSDGRRVRSGVLYRSTELGRLAGDDVAAVAALGVRIVFDLRTTREREAEPDRLPDGVRLVVCDVLADSQDVAPAQLTEVLTSPARAAELLGDGRAEALFASAYRQIVSLPSAHAAYRRMFTQLLDLESRPALFHCTTGKDRTGWAAAATLLLLGVPETDVFADYLLTNRDLLPALAPAFDRFRAAGGDPALLRPVLGVERTYLEIALDEMRARYGTIEGYFADALGLGEDAQRGLRAALVE
jgi:protein-tyrosine phosphatase